MNIRLEEHKLCLLVMIGVRADGRKELIRTGTGPRAPRAPARGSPGSPWPSSWIESAQDRWRAVNGPHLVALARAGAVFVNGKLAERPGQDAPPEAA